MNALAYFQIIGLVSSFVIRNNERGKRDTEPDINLCKEVNSTIYPVVGQTREGELRHIEQRRDGETNLQPVNITTCADPGSDCSGCARKDNQHKVCSNTYTVGRWVSLILVHSRNICKGSVCPLIN